MQTKTISRIPGRKVLAEPILCARNIRNCSESNFTYKNHMDFWIPPASTAKPVKTSRPQPDHFTAVPRIYPGRATKATQHEPRQISQETMQKKHSFNLCLTAGPMTTTLAAKQVSGVLGEPLRTKSAFLLLLLVFSCLQIASHVRPHLFKLLQDECMI